MIGSSALTGNSSCNFSNFGKIHHLGVAYSLLHNALILAIISFPLQIGFATRDSVHGIH